MRLFYIDARWMTASLRGMGKYAWQLIEPIKKNIIALAPMSHEKISIPHIYKGKSFFPYWEQVFLPYMVKNKNAILICPYNSAPIFLSRKIKLVLVVHDMIFMRSIKELPLSISLYQTLGRFYRRFFVPRSIKRANYIVTVSNYTKKEIISKYKIKKNIFVIPNSLSSNWFIKKIIPMQDRKNYLLTVSGEAPSKNLARLIVAYSIYSKNKDSISSLKIVGIKSKYHAKFLKLAIKYNISDRIEFINYINTEELQHLYRNAKGFIFPSLFEGFGIPLLEAMASGTPIACSNTTSIPEVVGDCAFQFSPKNVDDIINGLNFFHSNIDDLHHKIEIGLHRVKSYSEIEISNKFSELWSMINEKNN